MCLDRASAARRCAFFVFLLFIYFLICETGLNIPVALTLHYFPARRQSRVAPRQLSVRLSSTLDVRGMFAPRDHANGSIFHAESLRCHHKNLNPLSRACRGGIARGGRVRGQDIETQECHHMSSSYSSLRRDKTTSDVDSRSAYFFVAVFCCCFFSSRKLSG